MATPARKPTLRSLPGLKPPEPPPVEEVTKNHTIKLAHGDELHVTRQARTQYDFVGGSYYQMSLPLSFELGRLRLSGAEFSLLHLLMGSQERGGIIKLKQTEMAEEMRSERGEVNKLLKRLRSWGLVIPVSRGVYRVNPRVAFYGTSSEQAEVIAQLPDGAPEITLPQPRDARGRTTKKADGS
ncbi:hypothetical protein [Nocardiopsis sp. NPDC055824]